MKDESANNARIAGDGERPRLSLHPFLMTGLFQPPTLPRSSFSARARAHIAILRLETSLAAGA